MPFTDEEKVRIRHHLGYLNVQRAQTFVLGVPAGVQTQFIIEGAMDRVLIEAEPEARRLIAVLDTLESQLICDLELLAVDKVGEIIIRKTEMKELWKQYQKWQGALSNIMGIYPNPFDKRFEGIGVGAGVNVRVQH
jgi:hypothetical protein|tara:strand:+ start:305 stop:712 length:408 start_codon:yes stop_codon:yes gene_type:complete